MLSKSECERVLARQAGAHALKRPNMHLLRETGHTLEDKLEKKYVEEEHLEETATQWRRNVEGKRSTALTGTREG